MVMTRGDVQGPLTPEPTRRPNPWGRMLRTDVYRAFVVVGVLLALIASFTAVVRSGDGGTAATAGDNTFDVSLTELAIDPETIEAAAGSPVVLRVRNDGATAHNLVVEGHGGTQMLAAGTSEELRLAGLDAGTYTMYCEVSGHREGGMQGSLVVGEGGGGGHSVMDPEAMDAAYMDGLGKFPAETEGLGGQPLEPEVIDGVKTFELTADEFDWEVAPGDVRQAMGYNGVVPGPEIRVNVGDRVRVTLHNELAESTSIHFHGQNLPNDQDGVPGITQDLVKPGDTFTYRFTVTNGGTQIYHSHMNGANQVPKGLWGPFIVLEDEEPEVDLDTNIVLNDGPLGFTINGKGFPATQPVAVEPGQTVRIRYMNEGLQGHPMHLHGMEQEVVAKDGWKLDVPYKADTIWVAPGERYDVLVRAREGVWAFHCHILSHAENEQGMFGMVTAMVVQ